MAQPFRRALRHLGKRMAISRKVAHGANPKNVKKAMTPIARKVKTHQEEMKRKLLELPANITLIRTPIGFIPVRAPIDQERAKAISREGRKELEDFAESHAGEYAFRNAMRAVGINDRKRRAQLRELLRQNLSWEKVLQDPTQKRNQRTATGRIFQIQENMRKIMGKMAYNFFIREYQRWSKDIGRMTPAIEEYD